MHGAQVIGVDPSENLTTEANASGIKSICAYWGSTAAAEVARLVGQPLIITATNVLAHVDALHDFLANVTGILSNAGLFIFEVPYLVDLIRGFEFDTIYHEHLSYFLLKPLQYAIETHDLKIVDVQHRPIHGGTLRVIVAKQSSTYHESATVAQFLTAEQELGFYDNAVYESFATTVKSNKYKMSELLAKLVFQGKQIAGYGAAAKGNTLLNYYEIGCDIIKYITDDNPRKHNYLTPGTHIPIVAPSFLSTDPCDYLLLLAWNFADEIRRRTQTFQRSGGRYILPVPIPTIL
jgi:novobiocin biosynthesis protein NovU/D-mycarose 3-C-methyltransferase